MKTVNVVMAAVWLAFLTGVSAAGLKYVAVVETDVDAASGASADINPAEVREITAELRRQATINLPPGRYSVMTSETVQSMGGAVLEECSEENCVITLGSRIGAEYIVRGTISKFQTRLTLAIELYETNNGTLVISSEAVRAQNLEELLDKAAVACANMYKSFAAAQSYAGKPGVAYSQDGQYTQSPQYNQRKRTLTVNVSPPEGGTVSRNPSKKAYDDDEKVRLSVKTNSGYLFTGWSGAGLGLAKRLTLTMDGDMALTARFYRKGSAQRDEAPITSVTYKRKAAQEMNVGDTASVSKDFAGYDDNGKPVYRIKTKILVKVDNGGFYRTEKDYRVDGDTASKYIFVGRDDDGAGVYLGLTKQEFQKVQETWQDFSVGRRLGTWALNVLPYPLLCPTGLGSFTLMKDYVGGSIILGSTVAGYICILLGVSSSKQMGFMALGSSRNDGLIGTGIVIIAGNNIFNIIRSATYQKPLNRVSATASTFNPYDGLKLSVAPTESGDFKVSAYYDFTF